MVHNNREVLEYWENENVESMQDKYVVQAESDLIAGCLTPGSKILDAGCGEGEGTLVYASIPGTTVHGADFAKTRLKKAKQRVGHLPNVELRQVDFLSDPSLTLDTDYDFVVSQRFLINLMEWDLQKQVLLRLTGLLKPSGRLVLLEGSQQGVDELNALRAMYGLAPIPVRWHNLFLNDEALAEFMAANGYRLIESDGLGTYFMLTRGLKPVFDTVLDWNTEFNRASAAPEMKSLLGFGTRFSRLKLYVFGR